MPPNGTIYYKIKMYLRLVFKKKGKKYIEPPNVSLYLFKSNVFLLLVRNKLQFER